MNVNLDLGHVIANFQMGSSNSKTGNGVQVFFLPRAMIEKGKLELEEDTPICFNCPLAKGKGCYVPKGLSGWGLRSKLRSLHKKLILHNMEQILARVRDFTYIRLGAYGEPILLGINFLKELVKGRNWTGYTHQWRQDNYQGYKEYLMASVHSLSEAMEAEARGWRWFWSVEEMDPLITIRRGAMVYNGKVIAVNCPASKEAGRKAICNTCGLCKGTSMRARNIWIRKHCL